MRKLAGVDELAALMRVGTAEKAFLLGQLCDFLDALEVDRNRRFHAYDYERRMYPLVVLAREHMNRHVVADPAKKWSLETTHHAIDWAFRIKIAWTKGPFDRPVNWSPYDHPTPAQFRWVIEGTRPTPGQSMEIFRCGDEIGPFLKQKMRYKASDFPDLSLDVEGKLYPIVKLATNHINDAFYTDPYKSWNMKMTYSALKYIYNNK